MSEHRTREAAAGEVEVLRRTPDEWHAAFPDLLLHEDRFYILATSSLADERTRVLKHGETFAVFDHYGDIKPLGMGEEGLYHAGTRYLSAFWLRLGTSRPLFLSSGVEDEAPLLAVDLTNPDLVAEAADARQTVSRGTVHLQRRVLLWDACCSERLLIRNFGETKVTLPFSYHFAADFADLFEVRGIRRERRGTREEAEVDGHRVRLPYRGLDGARRVSELRFDPPPVELSAGRAGFRLELAPGEEQTIEVRLLCQGPAAPDDRRSCAIAGEELAAEAARRRSAMAWVSTSNQQLDAWLARGVADLHLLITETSDGPYPYAGVPWYSTPFGRDGLITALEWLVPYPDLAKGVLAFLAARQATETVPEQDAEPGKIVHELRMGEMAALGEVPFARYYGSVDSTPLFVLLAGRAWERTGDRAFFERLWPHVEAALDWIDREGDLDGD
ncbi:MAG TPA: glycogen debranching N-terminal domain-containing protein, partial [Thermoanaerobaculia bacterium]|nr:glycogen debranching N-terminal domain-containing protein [Thermoanaerobaculia bacterium]